MLKTSNARRNLRVDTFEEKLNEYALKNPLAETIPTHPLPEKPTRQATELI